MLLALALFFSTSAPSGPRAASDEWTALPVPTLCQPARSGAHPAALWDGRHVRLSNAAIERDGAGAAARLPIETLAQMLTEDARGHGTRLELFRATTTLLARGDAAAIDAARARIAELERAAASFEIELSLRLSTGRERDPKNARAAAIAPSSARIASGDEACFGSRASQGFVAGYSVEVAADSAVAQPVLGAALSGTTVHVRAARVEGGKRIHLSGVLDVAELIEIARFDPETPDLGAVQEPLVRSLQVVFAGVVDSGGTLEVKIEASPLAQADWSLSIQATTRPDETKKEGDGRGWTLVDCAFLAADPPALPPCRPGAGLDHRVEPAERGLIHAGLPPSAVAAAIDTGNDAPSGARQPVHWSNQLLIVPNADAGLVRSARELASGIEALRLTSGRIEIRHGALHADLPVTEGFPARLVVGSERPYVVGYAAEIAPQTWIASPLVEVALDGVCVDIDAIASSAACSFWSSSSQAAVEVPRKDAQLGKLQLLARTLRADAARLVRDEPLRIFLPSFADAGGKAGEPEPLGLAYRAR